MTLNKNTIDEIISSFKQLKRASNDDDRLTPIAKNYKEAIKLLTK